MFSKKNFFLLCSIVVSIVIHHTETSQTDLVCESVDWFLHDRQTLQDKGLIITSIISTYLQLVHVHLFTCQFLVSQVLKHFAFWNLIAKIGSTENKSVHIVFRAYNFRKAQKVSYTQVAILLFWGGNFIHKNGIFSSCSFIYFSYYVF